ncbi:anhydro-N-acetylmuramic acid kinase [Leptolyngbya sp. AN02str]|uniref:anhydro-N-acetylmuramic acid kinase n=1 Tax=Leptolyngbya sp. AN02str TaxID=3423363 RepID=UPI003D324197
MRVVGLMSGTSVDGIDAALVDITGDAAKPTVTLVQGATYPYPAELRSRILAVCSGAALSMAELAELDDAIAHQFAQTAMQIQQGEPSAELIGSHGQTVFHRPRDRRAGACPLAYSLQLGRGALIAHLTHIHTVSNFRTGDIAVGGEGAPLVPYVDARLLTDETRDRAVQNLGGIGNVTFLPAACHTHDTILGWDTGPGNVLLDLAAHSLSKGDLSYDADGAWASQGKICVPLVQQWLQHPYFGQSPPKSTGRELFGSAFLQQCLADANPHHLSAADILATLTELTAAAIAHSYRTFLPRMPDEVLLCGGGCRNSYLKARIQANLEAIPIITTDDVGLSSDFKEAIAFALLAFWRLGGHPTNMPNITGAVQNVMLGDLYPAVS